MANTKINELYPKALVISKPTRWYRYEQFKDKGSAVNYCINKNISLDKILPVIDIAGSIYGYAVEAKS